MKRALTVHTWRCPNCGASGEIKHRPWMDGNEKAQWGLAVLDRIMGLHDKQSPNCEMKGNYIDESLYH